jgi:hypothetical protein
MATFYMTADAEMYHCGLGYSDELYHYGVLGMKWGVRRYQNKDGSLTAAGKQRYGSVGKRKLTKDERKEFTETAKKIRKLTRSAAATDYNRDLYGKQIKKNSKWLKKRTDRDGKVNIGDAMSTAGANERKELYDKHSAKLHKDLERLVAKAQKKYGSSRIADISYKDTAYGKSVVNTYKTESLNKGFFYAAFMTPSGQIDGINNQTRRMASKQRKLMNAGYSLMDSGRWEDNSFNPVNAYRYHHRWKGWEKEYEKARENFKGSDREWFNSDIYKKIDEKYDVNRWKKV